MTGPTKYIPIGKGNFNLDTEERLRNFDSIRGFGWDEEYCKYRKLWYELPNQTEVSTYPLHVDLELSSVCNLHCPMCFNRKMNNAERNKAGFMDVGLFKKIVDEVSGHVCSIRLSLRGESTLHPHLIECLAYAKQKKILEVSMLTNGSKLTDQMIRDIVDNGIDWITISIDGVGDMYSSIRAPLTTEYITDVLLRIKNYKHKKCVVKPAIKVQSIWPAIRENPTQYYQMMAPLSDLVAFNPLIDYLRNDDVGDIIYEDNFICPQPYQRFVVLYDGSVTTCTNDEHQENVIGDAFKQTIYNIWHGTALQELRECHKEKNGFQKIKLCQTCFYPRKTYVAETTIVEGRDIYIYDYINRSQEIGK